MAVKLSIHAQQSVTARGLSLSWIEAAIAKPDRTARDRDPALTHSFKAIPQFGGRVLKVVHRPDGTDVFVVTAHFDRRARP